MIRWLLIIGGAIAALCGIAYVIDANGYDRAEAKYKLQASEAKKNADDALLLAQKRDADKYAAQTRSVVNLSEQLITANTTIDAQKSKLNERAHDVSTQYRPAVGAPLIAVPAWVVTNGWLCDYNRAIGYGVPQAGAVVSGAEDPACQADAFAPSAVTSEQILQHHEAYGAYTQKLEQLVGRLVDYATMIDGGKQ